MSDVSECFMSERSVGWEKKRKLSGVEEVVVEVAIEEYRSSWVSKWNVRGLCPCIFIFMDECVKNVSRLLVL